MRMLDLFSGIGGFHKGFEQAGYEFDWVGFSEIDKYASAVYRHRFPEAVELGDITTIQPGDLPKIDLITFGSPCQDFSIAGKRAGAKEGTRSSLIWQAIRLITECKPRFFVWENVKGTFSSNSGADFWAIIQAFTNIGGYRLEWQLINTRWFLPQNRERIYLVGYIGDRSGQSVFPIGETDEVYNRKQTQNHSQISNCIDSNYHKGWLDHGQRTMIAELNQIGTIGKDSMGSRVYADDGISCALRANGGGMGAKTGLYQIQKEYAPCIRAEHHNTADVHYIPERSQIRRLTPVECCRLQGFPDDWNEYGEFDGEVKPMSDTQRYKQCGNAVTVNVVQAVAERSYDILHD
jgi:DNA (cytosine-5)-methyltransferase 1